MTALRKRLRDDCTTAATIGPRRLVVTIKQTKHDAMRIDPDPAAHGFGIHRECHGDTLANIPGDTVFPTLVQLVAIHRNRKTGGVSKHGERTHNGSSSIANRCSLIPQICRGRRCHADSSADIEAEKPGDKCYGRQMMHRVVGQITQLP